MGMPRLTTHFLQFDNLPAAPAVFLTATAALLQAVNAVDFGQVIINEKCVRAFCMVNTGLIPYEYEWNIGEDPRLGIHPRTGRIGVGERMLAELSYSPTAPHKLEDYQVSCRIHNGRTYTMQLSGIGHRPKLHISFHTHDFGRVYQHEAGAAAYTVALQLRNDDSQVRVQSGRFVTWITAFEWEGFYSSGICQSRWCGQGALPNLSVSSGHMIL